jgi:peptide subunit release factor 1 (eRF1)
MTLTREQIRELADFEDSNSCALSFYFQPAAPRNKAHKEDAILIKDLARVAMRTLDQKEKRNGVRSDLDRIVRMAQELRSNGTHGKAVFANAARNFWREHDLPPQLSETQIFVDRRFHLKPLAHLLGGLPRLGVVLVDRQRARVFDFRLGELTEREGIVPNLSRKARSDGESLVGYDAGHAHRRADDETRQHFKAVAETVKEFLQAGVFENWILGCQDALRSQIQPQLHSGAAKRMLGHFHADLSRVTRDEIRTRSESVLGSWKTRRCHELATQVLNQARSHARGVTGLRRVLHSLEQDEVQTLLIGENLLSHAVECSACGHLDAHLVSDCPACGASTHEVVDVGEAILPRIIRRDVELLYVKDDAEFDKVGNIAALLRFNAEHASKPPSIATPVAKRSLGDRRSYGGRLQRVGSR